MIAKLLFRLGLIGLLTTLTCLFGPPLDNNGSPMCFDFFVVTMILSVVGMAALSILASDQYKFNTSTTRSLLILFRVLGIPFTLCWVIIIISLFSFPCITNNENGYVAFYTILITIVALNFFRLLYKLSTLHEERVEEDLKKQKFTERLIDLYNDPTVVIKTKMLEQMKNGQKDYVDGSLIMIEKTIIKDSFTKKVEATIPNVECSICYDSFQVGDFKTDIACHHSFHYKCIVQWGSNSSSCPLCRHSFRVQVLRSLLER
jgi:hypothetical protein